MGKKFDLAGLIAGQEAAAAVSDSDTIRRLPVEDIHDNSGNFYSVEDVKDLTDSISVSGVLQPILVRPRPEGGYLLIAGHRRTKAVRILRDEWKGKGENPWDTIPALVRPAPSTRAEELLEELALIQTNAAVRKLSDAEISAQAEKLTDILADLKREGYDFPGRMRKLVADALGVSETKLAKQKLIREKLSPGWLERWKAGTVAEYTAEALTKYSPELQEALLFKKKLEPYTVRSLAEYYAKCVAKRTCKVSHDQNCDWGDHFWAVGSRIEQDWTRCVGYGESCCKDCKKALKCGQCCPKALEAAKKAKKRQEEESKREKARQEREAAARKEKADILWARFKQLREAAGLSVKQTEDGIKGALEWSPALKPYEARDVNSWEIDRTPEQVFHFKTCWVAARLFGVPVEALTDVEWKPSPPGTGERIATAPAGPRNDGAGDASAEPYWRPFPKAKPPKGQRAMVVQHSSDYERLLFEAKLAEWDGEVWHWVSELIPDVEAERVELWFPEPAYPAETEDDDAEEAI
jgi:ParB-like chromosome segregation protein Spo0J